MRPTRITGTAVGNGLPVVLDIYGRSPVSLQVDVTGTINYTVQQTMDNVFDSSITPLWTDCADPNFVASTVDAFGGLEYTPFALRLVVNTVAGGSAVLSVLSGSFD